MTAAGVRQAEPFPWDEVMRIGLGVLRLSPKNFWAMTPREFAAAAGASGQRGAPPGRGELTRMMNQFPDRMAHG
ncbi:MAG TPA: rcc01693 family protein [Rhizobiaceae bacterium]|nr:rcc01693 family protein [Rhizobiaceae bacterium]